MFKIADPFLARMWAEKCRIGLATASIALPLAVVADVFFFHRVFALAFTSAGVAILLAMLWEMRYRMHKGTYGQRGDETADFDRWMERQGGKKITGMNLD